MRHWITGFGAAALALTLATATEAEAQRTFGFNAGPSVPLGEIGEEFDIGFHLSGLFEVQPAILPLPLRLEVGYQRFTHDDESLTHLTALVGTRFSLGDRLYLLGGAGLYNSEEKVDHGSHSHEGAERLFGVNAGLGLKLPVSGLNLVLESRFHNVFDEAHGDQRFVPISIGIRF